MKKGGGVGAEQEDFVFVFLLFSLKQKQKRERERTGTLPDEQRSKEENGDPSIRPYVSSLYSWPDAKRAKKKKKKKEEKTRAHDVSDVIHCVCGGGAKVDFRARDFCYSPPPPTFFVE